MSTTTEEIKALSDDLRSTVETFRSEHRDALGEIKREGDEMRAESKQTLERIDSRIDEIEAAQQKAAIHAERKVARESWRDSEAWGSWDKFLRRGAVSLSEQEIAQFVRTDGAGNVLDGPRGSMIVADDREGGFMAPTEATNELIKGVVEFSPIRSIARVRKTSMRSVTMPKRTTTAGATWAGEADAAAETTNPKLGQEEISTKELRALIDISRQDLEDTDFDLEQFAADEFAEQFGVTEGTAFVSGDGIDGKPEGFLTAADTGYLGSAGIETITSNTNDALDPDDFFDLFYGLKDPYSSRGTWVANRRTIRDARKLVDGNGQYLWQPGLASGEPSTILGRPVVHATDMPVVANGALAVAFGDFSRYLIVDRLATETLRDPYTQAPSFVRFWARRRVGGQVLVTEAFKLLQIQ